jgi:hypothetical protein
VSSIIKARGRQRNERGGRVVEVRNASDVYFNRVRGGAADLDIVASRERAHGSLRSSSSSSANDQTHNGHSDYSGDDDDGRRRSRMDVDDDDIGAFQSEVIAQVKLFLNIS